MPTSTKLCHLLSTVAPDGTTKIIGFVEAADKKTAIKKLHLTQASQEELKISMGDGSFQPVILEQIGELSSYNQTRMAILVSAVQGNRAKRNDKEQPQP